MVSDGDHGHHLGHERVEAFLDLERSKGEWLRVNALLGPPEDEIGLMRVQVLYLQATGPDAKPVALTTEEVNALKERFERAYNRARGQTWK